MDSGPASELSGPVSASVKRDTVTVSPLLGHEVVTSEFYVSVQYRAWHSVSAFIVISIITRVIVVWISTSATYKV